MPERDKGFARLSGETVNFTLCEDMAPDRMRKISRVTWIGMMINVALALVKSAAGFFAGSAALLADAAHTVSDLATDAAIIIGVKYWSAPADALHPHGHRKIETLVTVGIGAALALVGCGMGYEAVARLARVVVGEGKAEPMAFTASSFAALGAAVSSIIAKELLYRWTVARGVEVKSSAVIANAWHHRSDAFSSIPPALSIGGQAVAARYGRDFWYLDAIATVVVCVMLLQAAWEVTRPAVAALLDASADRKLCSAIRKTVLDTPGVVDAHRIRTRVASANAVAVDLHIQVDRDLSVAAGHGIAAAVKYRIMDLEIDDSPRAVDVMVHVEPAEPARLPGRPGSDTLVDWMEAR